MPEPARAGDRRRRRDRNAAAVLLNGVLVVACRLSLLGTVAGRCSIDDRRLGWACVALLVIAQLGAAVVRAVGAAARGAVDLAAAARAAVVMGVYLIISWAPASGFLWNAIDFHPEKTALGRLHQRYVKELLH